jgi:Holliday junction resolvase RusA-like endonuclease
MGRGLRLDDLSPEARAKALAIAEGLQAKSLRHKRAPAPPLVMRSYRPPSASGERHDDTLCLVLFTEPRSKKNHPETIYRQVKGVTRKFVIPSQAYRSYAADVKASLCPLRVALRLPLPPIPYTLSAVFFVSAEVADVDNMVVGLNDALQGAGVFTNDRIIRGLQIAPPVLAPDSPRVALTLTPVERV